MSVSSAWPQVLDFFGKPLDIEGVIIHGAQGARSLTVLLVAPPVDGKHGD
jgi:hypothetical protein